MDLIILIIACGLIAALFFKIIAGVLKGGQEELKKQKEAEEKRAEYQGRLRHYRYYVHGLNHKNEEGKKTITVILTAGLKINDFYRELKKKDFDDDPYMQVSEFEDVALEAELVPTEYEGEQAVKVYVRDGEERHHAGWISKEKAEEVADIIKKHRCITWMEIDGGKVKSLGVTEQGKDKIIIDEGEDPFPVVNVEYEAPE